MAGILGTKVGMTQIFVDEGICVPVTLVKCLDAKVVQRKTTEKDNYEALVVGLEKKRPSKNKKYTNLTEFKVSAENDGKVGDAMNLELFEDNDKVTIVGVSKGKGFQGVIKRHNFRSGPSGHGSKHHRQPGSIGTCKPFRTMKGKKLAGRMGADQVTLRDRQVVAIDKKTNCIAIKGAVPGATNSLVIIKKQ